MNQQQRLSMGCGMSTSSSTIPSAASANVIRSKKHSGDNLGVLTQQHHHPGQAQPSRRVVSGSSTASISTSANHEDGDDGVIAAPPACSIRSASTATPTSTSTTPTSSPSSAVVGVGTEEATSLLDAGSASVPAEIPPEPESHKTADDESRDGDACGEDDDDEEEDEYEYEDDDAPYSGFLVDNPVLTSTNSTVTASSRDGGTAPATIRDDDEPVPPSSVRNDVPPARSPAGASVVPDVARLDEEQLSAEAHRPKWRQPTREAVNMSLRAEQETTGGKRRLAQDLYRIMNQDTEEAGFSLEPTCEDSMDRWTIRLFKFDRDSNLARDMLVLGLEYIELEMSFPDQYPFEPPFVRVVRPRFKRQTGFVMNGALCMELLTRDGWNPINDIESVIVSVRSLLVVGDGRLEVAYNLGETKYKALLAAAEAKELHAPNAELSGRDPADPVTKRQRRDTAGGSSSMAWGSSSVKANAAVEVASEQQRRLVRDQGGSYTVSEAESAYAHLSDYHKKKGWDNSGWWAKKG